ncbi:MAG: hypothetical protein ACRDD2_09810 [Sarcina sp.]
MKKIFIALLIIVIAIIAGILSYKVTVKKDSSNILSNSNNTSSSTSGENTTNNSPTVNQSNSLQTIAVVSNETSTSNSESSTIHNQSSTNTNSSNSKNGLFGYNFGFNVLYNQNINPSYDQYKSVLNSKFQELFGNDKDVIIRVPYIFTTVRDGQVDAVAEYKVNMTKESNGTPYYYTSPTEIIWVPVEGNSALKDTAIFPQQSKTLASNMGEINPMNAFEYLNQYVYLNPEQEVYNLYSENSENSQIVGTVNSNQTVLQITNIGEYNLIYANGVLGWIKATAINDNKMATGEAISYPTIVKLSEPVDYNLTLKGADQEGSNMSLLKSAMNYEFNGTGDTVVATNLQGYEGMMHEGCYYNITYKTPEGKTVTLKNQSINGLTNPDNEAFAFWFNNLSGSPFQF